MPGLYLTTKSLHNIITKIWSSWMKQEDCQLSLQINSSTVWTSLIKGKYISMDICNNLTIWNYIIWTVHWFLDIFYVSFSATSVQGSIQGQFRTRVPATNQSSTIIFCCPSFSTSLFTGSDFLFYMKGSFFNVRWIEFRLIFLEYGAVNL